MPVYITLKTAFNLLISIFCSRCVCTGVLWWCRSFFLHARSCCAVKFSIYVYLTTGLQNEGEKMGCVEWKSTIDDKWDKLILMINGWDVLNRRVLLMTDEESSLFWWWDYTCSVILTRDVCINAWFICLCTLRLDYKMKEVIVNERDMLNEWVLVMIGEDRTLLWWWWGYSIINYIDKVYVVSMHDTWA